MLPLINKNFFPESLKEKKKVKKTKNWKGGKNAKTLTSS